MREAAAQILKLSKEVESLKKLVQNREEQGRKAAADKGAKEVAREATTVAAAEQAAAEAQAKAEAAAAKEAKAQAEAAAEAEAQTQTVRFPASWELSDDD